MINVRVLLGVYLAAVQPMWFCAVLCATRCRKRLYPTVLLDKKRLHEVALQALPIIYVGQAALLLAVVVAVGPYPLLTAFLFGWMWLGTGVPLWNELYKVPDNLKLADRGTRALFMFSLEVVIVATVLAFYYVLRRGDV